MGSHRELHIRATTTGAWFVQLDDDHDPLSWHTNVTEAERTALALAAMYREEASIVVHDRYGRCREDRLAGRGRA
jgi:hypothetical protein